MSSMDPVEANHQIEQLSALGFNKERVKQMLMGAGWNEADIEKAFGGMEKTAVSPVPLPNAVPVGKPRNAEMPVYIPPKAESVSMSQKAGFRMTEVVLGDSPHFSEPSKIIKIVFVAVFGVFALGGGVAAWFFLSDNPEKALYDAARQMSGMNLFHVTTLAEARITLGGMPGVLAKAAQYQFVSDQYVDVRTAGASKTKGQLRLIAALPLTDESGVSAAAPKSVALSVNVITTGGDIYIQPSVSAHAPVPGIFAPDIPAALQGKWIHLSREALAAVYPAGNIPRSGAAVSGTMPEVNMQDPQITAYRDLFWKLMVKYRPVTAEFAERGKETPEEPVDVIRLYLVREKLIPFLTEFSQGFQDSVKAETIEAMADGVVKIFGDSVSVWIGKESKLIKELHVDVTIPENKMNIRGTVSLGTSFSDIGKEESLEIPSTALSMEEAMKAFFGPMTLPAAFKSSVKIKP